jgi:hypothetical protein
MQFNGYHFRARNPLILIIGDQMAKGNPFLANRRMEIVRGQSLGMEPFMTTSPLRWVFSTALLVSLFLGRPPLHADEPRNGIEESLRSILPQDSSGTHIDDSQMIWAYTAAVVGFIVVFALAWFLVRVFAFLVIVSCFVGGIFLVCEAVHSHRISTWQQLAVVVVGIGIVAGVTAITANLYLLKGGIDGEKKRY